MTVRRIVAALAVAALSACGGGGGGSNPAGPIAPNPVNETPTAAPAPAQAQAPAPAPAATVAPASAALLAHPPADVNTVTAGRQTLRSVDALAGGGYAVAWLSQDASGSATLFAQRYDAQGAKLGAETRVAYTPGPQENPAIAVLRDGSVLVASVQARADWTVFAQRFDASGAPAGNELIVATQPQDAAGAAVMHSLAQPVVTALDDDGFAVGWASVADDGQSQVFAQHAQRFDASMRPAGAPVDFAAAGVDRNLSLRLVAAPGGNFVAGTTHRFNGIGYWQFRIGSTTVGPLDDANAGLLELNTTLLPLADGRYALWSTGSGGGYLQMLDGGGRPIGAASGVAVVPETAVNLPDGGWATITRQMPGLPFLAQRFDPSGASVGSSIELTTGIARPLAASSVGSGFALAWTAAGAQGDTDVRTQRVDAR